MAGCSHSRWPATAGKLGGHAAPRGQGEWCTGGQIHGYNHDLIGLTCLLGGKGWLWKGTREELEYAEGAGLLNFPPPAEERCLTACPHCNEHITNKELPRHREICKPKFVPNPEARAVMLGTEAS